MSIKANKKDIQLIQDILADNRKSYQILYDRYKKIITDYIRSRYSNYYDIEDDVSDVLIKIFINIKSYDSSKSRFKTWAISVAKNHMIDKWRCNTINYEYDLNGTDATLDGVFNVESNNLNCNCNNISFNTTHLNDFICNTYTTTCDNADIQFENSSSINYLITQISPVDFTLLDMKYVQGYDYNEIGSEFNLTSNTISNRVNYLKTKLKKQNTEVIYD